MNSLREVKFARRIYQRAIRVYPAAFRSEFGTGLLDTFWCGAEHEFNRRGSWALAIYLVRCLLDIVPDAVAAHLSGGEALAQGAKVRSEKGAWLRGLGQDAWYAARGLRRDRTSAGVAVVTLALGVGVTTSLFAVLYAVLLRPLAYEDSDRLVVLQDRSLESGAPLRTTGGAFLDWSEGTRSMADMALIGGATLTLTDPGEDPERVQGSRISTGYFRLLGIHPALGRAFNPEEMRGSPLVLILSDALWRGRYGADPSIIGLDLHLHRACLHRKPTNVEATPMRGARSLLSCDDLRPGQARIEQETREDNARKSLCNIHSCSRPG